MTDPEPITADCCICGQLGIGYGNNAQPVADGRCCDQCNTLYVIPTRLIAMATLHPDLQREIQNPSDSDD